MRRPLPRCPLFPYTTLFRSTEIRFDRENKPGVSNLLAIYAELSDRTTDQLEADYQGRMYGHRSEEHTSELQSRGHLVCRLLLEKKNNAIPHNLCGIRT